MQVKHNKITRNIQRKWRSTAGICCHLRGWYENLSSSNNCKFPVTTISFQQINWFFRIFYCILTSNAGTARHVGAPGMLITWSYGHAKTLASLQTDILKNFRFRAGMANFWGRMPKLRIINIRRNSFTYGKLSLQHHIADNSSNILTPFAGWHQNSCTAGLHLNTALNCRRIATESTLTNSFMTKTLSDIWGQSQK